MTIALIALLLLPSTSAIAHFICLRSTMTMGGIWPRCSSTIANILRRLPMEMVITRCQDPPTFQSAARIMTGEAGSISFSQLLCLPVEG